MSLLYREHSGDLFFPKACPASTNAIHFTTEDVFVRNVFFADYSASTSTIPPVTAK